MGVMDDYLGDIGWALSIKDIQSGVQSIALNSNRLCMYSILYYAF
jgi:hypothetical protein